MKTTKYAKRLNRLEEKETIQKLSRFIRGYLGQYLTKKETVLDIGCGTGHYMRALQMNGIKHVEGLDIDKSCVNMCKKIGLIVRQEDILKIKKVKKQYDVVMAFDIIEHISPDLLIKFIKKAMLFVKKGGVLLIRTPSMNNPFSGGVRYIDITHRTGFTEESLRQLMDETNISTYDIRYLDIFVIRDSNLIRFAMKLLAKLILRVTEFFFKIYYYCFNSTWKNMRLDLLLVIRK